jgi:tetratricopeptide (TPR) repeat protein
LARINKLNVSEYPKKNIRAAEMRFLRAHHLFELKRIFKYIVWADETLTDEDLLETSNRHYSDAELWNKIIEDFRFAVANLPDNNEEVGRANKFSAKAYLAKALLYAAYEQDEQNNVVNINKDKLQEVVTLVTDIGPKYKLATDFADNFRWETENGSESIFAIQSSHDDDTDFGRLNMTAALSYPMSDGYGCCGMHIPSQELVNAFKTDAATGLPLFDTFNQVGEDIQNAADIKARTVDPRLLHTVAIIGLPYKYKEGHIVDMTFPREAGIYYGAFLSIKETVAYDCPCFRQARWYYSSSLNRDILRYDDALLWKAEALIELGNLSEAREIINTLRERAAKSTALLKDENGAPLDAAHVFSVSVYNREFSNQDEARRALRWERRLELAMEAGRGFDLVRWGIAAETLNAYYATESLRREHLKTAYYTKNRDEYFPIPYQQISFSRGLYKQNYGWE